MEAVAVTRRCGIPCLFCYVCYKQIILACLRGIAVMRVEIKLGMETGVWRREMRNARV